MGPCVCVCEYARVRSALWSCTVSGAAREGYGDAQTAVTGKDALHIAVSWHDADIVRAPEKRYDVCVCVCERECSR